MNQKGSLIPYVVVEWCLHYRFQTMAQTRVQVEWHNEWLTLHKETQDYRSCSSTWGFSKSERRSWHSRTLSMHLDKELSNKSCEPQRGQPRNLMPPVFRLGLQTSEGNSGKDWSPEGQKTSHLEQFRMRSWSGPWDCILLRSVETDVQGPTNVPLSRNHIWSESSGTGPKSSSNSTTTRENSKGPKGSPCCTPALDIRQFWHYILPQCGRLFPGLPITTFPHPSCRVMHVQCSSGRNSRKKSWRLHIL
jgi:hypothetical protein